LIILITKFPRDILESSVSLRAYFQHFFIHEVQISLEIDHNWAYTLLGTKVNQGHFWEIKVTQTIPYMYSKSSVIIVHVVHKVVLMIRYNSGNIHQFYWYSCLLSCKSFAFCEIYYFTCFYLFICLFIFKFIWMDATQWEPVINVIIFLKHFSPSTSRHLSYRWPSMRHNDSSHKRHHFKIKGQGHFMVKSSGRRNPYILRSSNHTNSKLGVKVAYGLALS
jgi:hypothetical protein